MNPVEVRLIGLFYLILSLFPLPFHIIVSLAILRSKPNRIRPPYIILVVRSGMEMGQLLIHALSGICALTDREFCESVHVFMGNALFFFWITTVFLHVLLSLNRFITFVSNNSKFSIETTYFLVTVCVIGGAFCMAGCSENQIRFRLENMAWKVENKTGLNVAINYIQIGLIVVGLGACSFVVLFLADQKRKLSQSRIPIKQTEVRIFIHSTISFLFMASNLFLHFPLNLFFKNELATGIVLNTEWILICGLPPFLAIWMNNEISKSIRELTIRDPPTKVNTVSIVT